MGYAVLQEERRCKTCKEKLSTDAVDCALISKRATDPQKKELSQQRSLRQTRPAQTSRYVLKLGEEDDVIGPASSILQPLGDGVVRHEAAKLGDGGLGFTLPSSKRVSGGKICVGNPKGLHCDGAMAPINRFLVLAQMSVRVTDVEVPSV